MIATRGAALGPGIAVQAVSGMGSTYDEIKHNIARGFKEVCEVMLPIFPSVPTRDLMDLFVAGWATATDRPDSYAIFNHDTYGVEPWVVTDIGESSFTPGEPEALAAIRAGLPADAASTDDLDIDREALRSMEIQRGFPAAVAGMREKLIIVGGFVQLTTVTRDRITTRILRRWADPVGARIVPARSA